MISKKVKLQYIHNDSTRRSTFKRRICGLMKKEGDLVILCDAQVCVAAYGEGKSVPQVFPSHAEVVAILNQFKNLTDQNQYKKIMDHEFFLLQRIDKLRNQVHKSEHDCQEHEISSLLHKAILGKLPGLAGLSSEYIENLGSKVEVLLKSIADHIEKIRGDPPVYQPSAMHALTPNITSMNIIGPEATYLGHGPSQQHEG